ncbi:ketopantoate reductase family protein [Nocardioides acrostichi]|uniref:2-dehydropantoate 2-reductase n=1 Tax=Nocardioides acrostichi TaxID=2784339 RepID=A0A930V3B3_9ACTN|nr:2-dehydropantoate 2-reductase [Nocardioides acrostichi]MBF4163096.1 2-dehydropantoate 2-reductase [Nocardioides acrostichi]
MRYCVWGLGAIGGSIAAGLAGAGLDVVGLARPATVEAVRRHGMRVRGATTQTLRLPMVSAPEELDDVDVVVLAVKSTAVPALADALVELRTRLGEGVVVVTAMNGLPWWFGDGVAAEHKVAVSSADQRLRAGIPATATLGMAVHLTATTEGPGVVVPTSGRRLVLGAAAPHGPAEQLAPTVAADLRAAGFDAEASDDIRAAVWFKLLGNLALNPLSMVTRSPVDTLLDDPLVHDLALAAMTEAREIGRLLGLDDERSPADRLVLTRRLGSFRTSMHQDADAGRPVELEALLGSVHALGTELGVPTPALGALLGVSRLHARSHGLL